MSTIEDVAKLSYYYGIKIASSSILQAIDDSKNKDIMSIDVIKSMLNHEIIEADSKLLNLAESGIVMKDNVVEILK